ncbi:MAG TPA: hypothetical protein VND93_19240, partial [Myxococcales bacterium]|nr:hypothetical protein [Myxococcales bacterium]
MRLRAALLLSAPLALVVGCFPSLEGAPCETDQNCPSSQRCGTDKTCREGERPPRAATMSAAAELSATTASVGQSLMLTLTLTNTGTIILDNIVPGAVTSTGTATGTVLAGPAPATVDRLIPGASTSFTWTVQAQATGTLSFNASAQATASDTSEPVTATGSTAGVTVQQAAVLEVTSLTGPSSVSRGQTFSVTMVVTNRGQARATLVSPTTPTVAAAGSAGATGGALPAAISIDGGATGTFQLTFTENGTGSGSLTISAGATGQDANSGAPLTALPASSNAIAVQRPAALSITSFTLPATIGRGSAFVASLTVTNSGQAAANVVLPSPDPPVKTVTAGADATTSTSPAAVSIPGGGARTFAYSYTENGTGPGTIQLSAGATGTDANTGQTITAPTANSNTATVQAGGALVVTSFTIPASLSRGQGFNAVMVVTNSGGSTVNGVAPSSPVVNKTG